VTARRWRRLLLVLLGIVIVIVLAARLVFGMEPFGGRLEGARLVRAQANPQWRDGAFVNPR
jgi:hypothetical protein